MSILSKMFGKKPVASSSSGGVIEAGNSTRLPEYKLHYDGFDAGITNQQYRRLVSNSIKLDENFSPLAGLHTDWVNYAIGNAYQPISLSKNKEWADKAEEWLINEFFPISDYNNVLPYQEAKSVQARRILVEGDCFTYLTKTAKGYPQFQYLSGTQIGQRQFNGYQVEQGRFKGYNMYNGIITTSTGRPVAVNKLGRGFGEDQKLPMHSICHYKFNKYFSQSRGISTCSYALGAAKASMTATEYEQFATLMASAVSLVVYNETGTDENDDAFGENSGITKAPSDLQEKGIIGGLIKYFKAGSGAKIEQLRNERPGDQWDQFQDRLVRMCCVGSGFPYEMVWKGAANGTLNRTVLSKTTRAVERLQRVINHSSKKEISYAIACAIDLGILEYDPDWYKWSFTLPPKLTIDYGREAQQAREDYKMGIKTMTDIVGEMGKSLEPHIRQRAREEQLFDKISKETGISVERLRLITINGLPLVENSTQENTDETSENN